MGELGTSKQENNHHCDVKGQSSDTLLHNRIQQKYKIVII